MANISLDIALFLIIIMVVVGRYLNEKFKIPLVHSLIVFTFGAHSMGWISLFDNKNILPALFLLIPIVLLNDVLHLKFKDVKKYKVEIFLLAFVGVIISVLLTATITFLMSALGVGVAFGAYLAIAVIITATDAISVSNIFAQFKSVSHEDKVLMEGDSLGNDGTSIIIFYFIALPWMIAGTFDFTTIPLIAFKVFAISTLIGFVCGYAGYFILKLFKHRYEEFLITVASVYGAFILAEWIHVAGVFALIVAGMTFNTLVLRDIYRSKKEAIQDLHDEPGENKKLKKSLFSNFKLFKKVATTEKGHQDTVNLVGDFGFIAVAVLFVALSEIINPSSLIKHWEVILIFFLVSTFSRGFTLGLFVGAAKVFKLAQIGFNGWFILTLSGIKGGLSIIMVYSVPATHPLLEVFEAITVGIILSTIFVYGFTLLGYMIWKEKKEEVEKISS